MATALSEEELDNEDYYSLLNVRREVRLSVRRPLGGGRAPWFGRAGLAATAPSPPRAAGTRRGGRVTPPDMRDRPPTGRSLPPRPLHRGCPGRPLPLLPAAKEPRPGKARGSSTHRREGVPEVEAPGVGFPVLPDPVPRPARKLASAEGLCHHPWPAEWETESPAPRSRPRGNLPAASVGFPSIHGDVPLLK